MAKNWNTGGSKIEKTGYYTKICMAKNRNTGRNGIENTGCYTGICMKMIHSRRNKDVGVLYQPDFTG